MPDIVPDIVSKIHYPDEQYARIIRDSNSVHYVGITTTDISTSPGSTTQTITIGGKSYTAKVNDTVLMSTNNAQYIWTGSAWQSMVATSVAPGDANVSIQVNSVEIGHFSMNQASPDVDINISSIPAEIVAVGALANGMTATTQAKTDSSTKLATTKFVQDVFSDVTEPMKFIGGVKLIADSTDTTKCSIKNPDGSSLSSVKKGYVYKVTEIASSPVYTGTLKIGDTIIADKASPKTDATWVVGTDWTVVPSGDEPSGTVTGIVGKNTSGVFDGGVITYDENDNPGEITTTGTVALNLVDDGVLPSYTHPQLHAVGLDDTAQYELVVSLATDGGTNGYSDSNPYATVETIDNKINAKISSTTATVYGLSSASASSVVANVSASSPASGTSTGEVVYAAQNGTDSECLDLKKLILTTQNTTTTSNLLVENTSP